MKLLAAIILSLGIVACSSNPHRESTGQYVDNSSISMRVKTNLLTASDVSGSSIDVESYKGTVILSGFVDSQEEKDRAIEITKKTPGVRSVKAALYVKEYLSE